MKCLACSVFEKVVPSYKRNCNCEPKKKPFFTGYRPHSHFIKSERGVKIELT